MIYDEKTTSWDSEEKENYVNFFYMFAVNSVCL